MLRMGRLRLMMEVSDGYDQDRVLVRTVLRK